MPPAEELTAIAERLRGIAIRADHEGALAAVGMIEDAARDVGKAWSGSWIGYHATVYYAELQRPPAGAMFSTEWGIEEKLFDGGTTGDWGFFTIEEIQRAILERAGHIDAKPARELAKEAKAAFDASKADIQSVLTVVLESSPDAYLQRVQTDVDGLSVTTQSTFLNGLRPKSYWSRDSLAMSQGLKVPAHLFVLADMHVVRDSFESCTELSALAQRAANHLKRRQPTTMTTEIQQDPTASDKIFIGHGRSPVWKDLRDFLRDRLKLSWEEFNRVPTAGISTVERLSQMLQQASFAFIVLTAEDQQIDGTVRARENVVHEAGLFQGRLGFKRAIILLEEECEEFSNIQGLGQIRFPKGDISAKSEEIRKILEREGIIS